MNPITESTIGDLLGELSPHQPDLVAVKLARALRAVRKHLGMDIAFVSEFNAGRRIFRAVDADDLTCPVRAGSSDPLEQSYCQRVVDGRLPELIHDATALAEARALPVTNLLPVGAHLSVPIRMTNGEVFGTFCCFSHSADHTLTERDLSLLRAVADVIAALLEEEREVGRRNAEAEMRIRSVLEDEVLSMVYQPIYDVAAGRIVGFESLARFQAEPKRSPDKWFAEAATVGLGTTLELQAIEIARRGVEQLPQEVYVSINVSPATLLDARFAAAIARWPAARTVIEVTEHAVTDCYVELGRAMAPLRAQGIRFAVDDAGAGYASFRHILSLAPDMIKLDMSLTRNVDTDPMRSALAQALIGFAHATGSTIVAEGVEREPELATLRALGVNKVQGYFIGKPMSLEQAMKL